MTETDLVALGQSTLEHYGVKGMKWGVRKDQKSSRVNDGSKSNTSKKKPVRKSNTRDFGSISSMSSSELEALNRRLTQEINLKRNIATLNKINSPKSNDKKYGDLIGKTILEASTRALGNVVASQLTHVGMALVSGDKDLIKKAASGKMVKLDIQSGMKKKMNTIAGINQGKKKN